MEFKTCKFESQIKEDRTFEGYASTFGNIDSDGDIIERGAYAKSISERFPANRIKVKRDHIHLIGLPTHMEEDSKGLFVAGKISDTPIGQETITLAKDGVIDSMSVGFSIPAGKSGMDDKGIRHIREAKLYEFSLVGFPANEQAAITGVKALQYAAAQAEAMTRKERAELEAEIKHLLALLRSEPPNGTHDDQQPLAVFSDFIQSIRGIAQ